MFRTASRFASRSTSLFSSMQRPSVAQPHSVITPLASLTSFTSPLLESSSSSTRWMSSAGPTGDDKYFHRTSFVHPLSQIVLEYLQTRKSNWLLRQGLDHSLTVHPDGSFEMKYPPRTPNPQIRIFTCYDREEAKHYLVVEKGYLNQKYMLQDNKASPWHANKKSVYERIRVTVDELMHAVDRLDGLEREKKWGSRKQ